MSDLRAAGIVSRLIAAAIDIVIVGIVLGGAYLGLTLFLFAMDVRSFTFPQFGWLFTTSGFLVTSFAYLALCWVSTGRTIGNVMMGLRVVRIGGQPLRFVQAVLRAAGYVVFPIGLFWVVLSPKRLSLQDALLRTMVVYNEEATVGVERRRGRSAE